MKYLTVAIALSAVHLYTVLPQCPRNVEFTEVRPNSVKLRWEQVYDSEDEKPTKYLVKVADWPDLSHTIDPTVYVDSPSKCTCEYVLDGLEPETTFKVIITAENEDGTNDSEELLVICKSSISCHYFKYLVYSRM